MNNRDDSHIKKLFEILQIVQLKLNWISDRASRHCVANAPVRTFF